MRLMRIYYTEYIRVERVQGFLMEVAESRLFFFGVFYSIRGKKFL